MLSNHEVDAINTRIMSGSDTEDDAIALAYEVKELRDLVERVRLVMIRTGNALNWPAGMPMEYADVINALRIPEEADDDEADA